MERLTDNYYIDCVRAGKTECFAPLLERYGKQVFSLVAKIIGNREDAEEVTQDVFVKAYRSLTSFRGDSSFSTWLYRIAYNMSVSATRRQVIPHTVLDEEITSSIVDDDEPDAFSEDVRLEYLEQALTQLSPDDRAMILMHYKEDRPMAEIAVITGLTETNVKTRIFRIRKKLYDLITKKEKDRDG
ncbi:MAG: sigma-70 family RNA polymerase sigma factor [Tannerella sp.]|jgi:RNA polymerase sigma-70 factor (ECF subfamily)|nr:sigma-70 family RNA polymerase sigma factor [Tannerella sp.]